MGDKKKDERFFVARFLEATAMAYSIEPRESPDFLLHKEEASLGLEVTQLLHPETRPTLSRRRIESLRDQIVSRARSLYEKERGPIAIVSVIFNSSLNITKSDVPQLANKLMGVVIRNLPMQYGSKSEEFNWENRGWFPEEINRVSVSRFPEINDSHWYSPDAEYLPACTIELVQSVIEKKNAKLVNYVKLVSECWLLIVLDDFRLSGAFIIPQEVLDHTYSSGFKKVFLFQSFNRRAHSLNISSL